MYVDDFRGSRETVTKVKQIIIHIDAVLAKGNFQIKTRHSDHAEIDQSNSESNTFKKSDLGELDVLTKRHRSGLVGQLWNPIGLGLPITIKLRIDLQELWSLGYNWDDILPPTIQSKWIENAQTINHLPQVHGFCDGGKKAYRAVIFLHWELKNGSYKCVPVLIKSKGKRSQEWNSWVA